MTHPLAIPTTLAVRYPAAPTSGDKMTPAFLAVVHNHPTSSAAGEVPEATEPGGCSACARTEEKVDRLTVHVETFGQALLRVEAGLGALLSDIAALKARMDAEDAR